MITGTTGFSSANDWFFISNVRKIWRQMRKSLPTERSDVSVIVYVFHLRRILLLRYSLSFKIYPSM